jgi:WD40 repeat protein
MKKLILLTLLDGNFEKGFPVILEMGEDGKETESKIIGFLPGSTKITEAFTNWQQDFRKKVTGNDKGESPNYSRMKPLGQARVFSSTNSAEQLKQELNQWLNYGDEKWQKIRDRLQRYLTKNDEIRVVIQTEENQLRQLPWQEWDVLKEGFPNSEIALSTTEYELPKTKGLVGEKIRIIAVLGGNDNIDTKFDRQQFEKLPKNQADIYFIEQPTKQDLLDALGDKKGWHIFFFAGHSYTCEEIGYFEINQKESLRIDEFKNTLKEAISNGLQLVIFNSCDGLGLAKQLQRFHLPQMIVMREPIPDQVAQNFLRDFLTEFASNQSFYTSVLFARKRLEDAWDKKYPGVSWLPVICQNPAVNPPTWQDFLPPPSWKVKHILTGHTQPIICVAMSPDGKTIASGSQDNTIKLWNAATGELLETLTGHHSAIIALAFSPDGKILASSSNHEFNDGTIKLWDLNTRKLQKSLGASLVNLRVGSLAFSRDQQYLASGHIGFTAVDTAIRIWQIDRGKVAYTLKGHGWEVTAIAFSSDGRILVSGGADSAIMIWDWRAEKRLRTLNRPDDFFGSLASWFDQSKGIIWAIAISPDDKIIASGGSDQPIYLWNLETGKLEKSLTDHEGYVCCLAFSPDRQTLASGGKDNMIRIWNYHTGELLQTLEHLGTIKSLAFSPDGQTLVSGSWDRTVKIWHFA